jgi:hypothetical protein
MDKSYVTMEQNVCKACGKTFSTDALLLDRGLRERFEKETLTGWGICPDDQAKLDEGYVILVGANPPQRGNTLQPGDADRTGEILYMKRELADDMFNVKIDSIAFIEPEVIEMLKEKME